MWKAVEAAPVSSSCMFTDCSLQEAALALCSWAGEVSVLCVYPALSLPPNMAVTAGLHSTLSLFIGKGLGAF